MYVCVCVVCLGLGLIRMKLGEDEDGGLYVESVQPSLPAAKAGIRAGDYVRKLNGQFVMDFADFKQISRRAFTPGAKISVEIKRSMQVYASFS